MRISRSKLMAELESVRFGISLKNIVEQSSCFVFKQGKVFTFNDEVACWSPTDIKFDTPVVVPSGPLLAVLPRLPDDELMVELKEGAIVFKGKNKEMTVRIESDCRLPIDTVSLPKAWSPIPPEFTEGISTVSPCAGVNDAEFLYTLIHITDRFVEASDNSQIGRWRMKVPLLADKNILIRRESAKSIIHIEPNEVALGDGWVFFRQGKGSVMIGCRLYPEEKYPDLTPYIQPNDSFVDAGLPSGLGDAAETASKLSADNADNNLVTVKMNKDVAVIIGEGAVGVYKEKKRVKYGGPLLEFSINPTLLIKLVKEHSDCKVSDTAILVKAGRLTYVVSLDKPQPVTSEEPQSEE